MSLHTLDTEKRQFSRIAFDAPVTIRSGDNIWKSKLIDVSLKGALIAKPKNWDKSENTNFELSFQLGDSEIVMEVKLVHYKVERIGFQCVHIDIDSASNLRRLVELNIGNEDLLEKELSSMSR